MPIKVVCQCGASFAAKDEMAGKAVRCPKCQQPLKIPGPGAPAPRAAAPTPAARPAQAPRPAAAPMPSAMDDLFDEAGIGKKSGPVCPRCMAELKPNAVMCVKCGFDFQTGQSREGTAIKDAARKGHGEATDDLMARAEKQIEVDKVEEKKNVSAGGMPAWLLIIMLLMVVAFSITMMLLPREYVIFTGGVVLIGVTVLYDLAVWGYIVLRAFTEEGIGSAILNFFFPIVFVAYHWDECAFMWIVMRYNGFLIIAGLSMIGASNLFNDAENLDEEESFLRSTNSRVVVEAAADPSLVEILRLAARLDSRA